MGKKIRFWNDLSVYNFSGERDPEKRVRFDESVVKSEDGKNWRQRERERERAFSHHLNMYYIMT